MTLRHDTPAARWRKSDRSGSGNCVEVAELATGIALRDSKAPETGPLVVTREAWTAFVADVEAGRYDRVAD